MSHTNLTKLANRREKDKERNRDLAKAVGLVTVPSLGAYGAHRFFKSDLAKIKAKTSGRSYEDAKDAVVGVMHNMSSSLRKGKKKYERLRNIERGGLLASGIGLGIGGKKLYDLYKQRQKKEVKRVP